MNYNIKKLLLITFITLFLSACVTTGNNVFSSAKEKIFDADGNTNNVGLNLLEENIDQEQQEDQDLSSHRNLNIVIPTFDPGIENDEKIFQELRNFESRRFAVKLKTALEDTNRVGAVRVTPNTSASGQIYVLGKIKASNGQKVKTAQALLKRLGKVLDDEQIEYDKKVLAELIQKYYPDFRRTINELQRYSVRGKIDSGILFSLSEANTKELIKILKEKRFNDMRKWVINNLDKEPSSLFSTIYELMYSALDSSSVPQSILIIAGYQYKSAFVADQEINMVACLTEIMANCKFK